MINAATKRNFAIAADPAAIPVNPNSAATTAITANISAHLSMSTPLRLDETEIYGTSRACVADRVSVRPGACASSVTFSSDPNLPLALLIISALRRRSMRSVHLDPRGEE